MIEEHVSWVLSACVRVLRPLVRLALSKGVKHQQLDDALRDLMLEEAARLWRARGVEPTISQLSITTGLNRKAVTTKVREPADSLPHTELSGATRTLTLWLQLAADDPARQVLPLTAEGNAPSFESLARDASRGNVHHRTILDELLRLDMVELEPQAVRLKASAFVPVNDLQGLLAFFGDNLRDHLHAGVQNVLGQQPRMLERSVFASGLSLQDCERIHALARQRWDRLNDELAREMRKGVQAAPAEAAARLRIGIFAYYEDGGAGTQTLLCQRHRTTAASVPEVRKTESRPTR